MAMATAEERGRRAMAARWDRWGGDIATGKECFGAEIWSRGEVGRTDGTEERPKKKSHEKIVLLLF